MEQNKQGRSCQGCAIDRKTSEATKHIKMILSGLKTRELTKHRKASEPAKLKKSATLRIELKENASEAAKLGIY